MSDRGQADLEQMKERIAAIFNRAAPTYDRVGPRFISDLGRRLVELAQIASEANVLDVATGKGAVLLPAAEVVGPRGKVIGVDLSEAMVDQAAGEIDSRGLRNAEVRQMDAEHLQFPDASFDHVLCGFSMNFFPRPHRFLSESHRVLKPNGRIAVTTPGRGDERWKWYDELLMDYWPPQVPQPEWGSGLVAGPDELRAIVGQAGFVDIRVLAEQVEFVYASEQEWWSVLWSTFFRSSLEMLEGMRGPDVLQAFKAAAFAKLQDIRQPGGFPYAAEILFALAAKPQM